ncbi:Nn.00g028420.m01.CDS01 [Neocucurbitaria sp. VM-36]
MSNNPNPTTKGKEAEAEDSRATQEQQAPPYSTAESSRPPTYESLSAAVHSGMSSLTVGDPQETISVPMITRRESFSLHNYNPFSRKSGEVTQTVIIRKMTRDYYLKHYAKDSEGNFIGTSNPAPDSALVFVPGKSTPEDVMRQVEEVVFRKQEQRGKGIGKFGMPLNK